MHNKAPRQDKTQWKGEEEAQRKEAELKRNKRRTMLFNQGRKTILNENWSFANYNLPIVLCNDETADELQLIGDSILKNGSLDWDKTQTLLSNSRRTAIFDSSGTQKTCHGGQTVTIINVDPPVDSTEEGYEYVRVHSKP